MRGSRWFIFFVLAFLLLMFAIEYHLPKKFVWVPTFSHYDEQPFGCAVFDSLLTVSLPSGYTLSRKTFYQMEQEDTVHNKGILLIATNLPFGRVDIEALLKMADRGNKIMLVSSSFTKILEDTLKFDCTYSYFRSVDLKKYAASLLKRDSIYWIGKRTAGLPDGGGCRRWRNAPSGSQPSRASSLSFSAFSSSSQSNHGNSWRPASEKRV